MTLEHLRAYYGAPAPRTEPAERQTALDAYSIENLPSGKLFHRGTGACYIVETARAAHDVHGIHRFGELEQISAQGVAALARDSRLADFDIKKAVFLDTETTGLGVGAGTYVFLVGAGFFADDRFYVKQFFLRGPHEEPAFLDTLSDFLGQFTALVTFNGKAFDWPLVENRYVRHRRPVPILDVLHADLLHPARRLWKGRLSSCALKELESHILQVQRAEDDVPGWQIPELYFRYQRTGDGRALRAVFYHNLWDVLSLAGLAIHLHAVVHRPFGGTVRHAEDFLALGKMLEAQQDDTSAAACYYEVLKRTGNMILRRTALSRLGALHKRRKDWDAAMSAWSSLLAHGTDGALESLTEQAKYFEHVAHDLGSALDVVRQALDVLQLHGSHRAADSMASLEHRYHRLLARTTRLKLAG